MLFCFGRVEFGSSPSDSYSLLVYQEFVYYYFLCYFSQFNKDFQRDVFCSKNLRW